MFDYVFKKDSKLKRSKLNQIKKKKLDQKFAAGFGFSDGNIGESPL